MAVLSEVPGLVVSIEVNGRDLPEYDDDEVENTPTSCTKYVESVSGANFALSMRFDCDTFKDIRQCTSARLVVDGKGACQQYFSKSHLANSPKFTIGDAITNTSSGFVKQALHFAELIIEDEAPNKELINKVKDLGTVTAELYHARLVPNNGAKTALGASITDDTGFHSIIDNNQIPEKILKGQAISHQAGFGRAQPHQPPSLYPECIGLPFATYIFKYRSRPALQALTLIPRTPSPPPLEDRPIEVLTIEELRERLRRQEQERTTKKFPRIFKSEFKRERDAANVDDKDDDDSEVELVKFCRKRSKSSHGIESQVIELSDDE